MTAITTDPGMNGTLMGVGLVLDVRGAKVEVVVRWCS